MSTFGTRLQEARGAVSRNELATICGVVPGAIRMWETDNSTPQFANLVKIAEHLQIRLDWLVFNLPPQRRRDAIDVAALTAVMTAVADYLEENQRSLSPHDLAAVNAALYNEVILRPSEDSGAYLRGMIAMATRT